MNAFLISPKAMGFFPILIWHCVILGYLLKQKPKSTQTWLLTGWFTALTLIMAAGFLGHSWYAPGGGYIFWMGGSSAALLAVTLEIQFAYRFPCRCYKTESHIVLLITVVCNLGLWILMAIEALFIPAEPVYTFGQFLYGIARVQSGQHYLSALLFEPLHITGHVWALSIWLRITLVLSNQEHRPWPHVLRFLWKPQGQPARAARAMALWIMGAALTAGVQILEAQGLLPVGIFAILYALLLFGIVLTYIDNAPEPSTLMVKLIGISLVTLLSILGLINPLILNLRQNAYHEARQSELAHIKTIITTRDKATTPSINKLIAADIPPKIRYIASHPAESGALANIYQMLYSREKDVSVQTLAEQDLRISADLLRETPFAQQIVLDLFPWLDAETLDSHAPLPLPPADIPLAYRGALNGPDQHYIRYLFLVDEQQTVCEVGYAYRPYRQLLHQTAVWLLLITLGTTLLILFIFPRFFQRSVARPLADLLTGVAQVNTGDLDVTVPIHQEDEIGFLAHSFNTMVRSRRRAEAEVRALFDHAPLCIFAIDARHSPPTITQSNQQVARTYGWSPAALVGHPITALIADVATADIARLGHILETAQTTTLESQGRRRDGTPFPIRLSVAPIAAPEAHHSILIIQDITAERARRSEEEAIAEERRRIAREIHDGIAQDLAALRVRVGLWHDLVDEDPAGMHTELDTLQDLLRANIHEVRRAIFALRPVALEELGFYPALQRFIKDLDEQNNLHIALDIAGPPAALPATLEPVVFRIFQEALNNIVKHAQASSVWLHLNLEAPTILSLQVRDNGRGFDTARLAEAARQGHFGLTQMQERVIERQGTFEIHSQPGKGTDIHITIPKRET